MTRHRVETLVNKLKKATPMQSPALADELAQAVSNKPSKIYVASSWRNPLYDGVIATFRAAGLDLYDFKNPPDSIGFSWQQVGGQPLHMQNTGQGAETAENYLRMIRHPRAVEGYHSDIDALLESDTVVLVLPCGRSAHLELGIAIGAGKRTAIFLTETLEPELMYKAVDFMTTSMDELLTWLGVEN